MEAKSFGWIDQVAGVPLLMSLRMNDKAVNLVSKKMLAAHVLPKSLFSLKEKEAKHWLPLQTPIKNNVQAKYEDRRFRNNGYIFHFTTLARTLNNLVT